jgi:hypothetical protein
MADLEKVKTVPFYRPGYKEKNLAPEKIPVAHIESLVKAMKISVQNGALSPEIAKKLLPIALKEGRPDFGNNVNGYANNPRNREIVNKLFDGYINTPDDMGDMAPIRLVSSKLGNQLLTASHDMISTDDFAKLSALKLAMTGQQDPNKAVEMYNGKGKQAVAYSKAVGEYEKMIDHEDNKELRTLVDSLASSPFSPD